MFAATCSRQGNSKKVTDKTENVKVCIKNVCLLSAHPLALITSGLHCGLFITIIKDDSCVILELNKYIKYAGN